MLTFKNKRYLFSSGLAFYPEKIILEIKEQASVGWQLKKINPLGFFVYEKSTPEEKEFTIDFYEGKKRDLPEYLEIYQEAGWEKMLNYKNRYFFFKGEKTSQMPYSEADSYRHRIKKEWWWLFFSSLWCVPIGFFIYWLLSKIMIKNVILALILKFIAFFGGIFFMAMPLSVVINVLYNLFFYKKRPEYYQKQTAMGKVQEKNYHKDLWILAGIGGVLGGIGGFVFGMLFHW